MRKWFLLEQGEKIGPFSEEILEGMVQRGEIEPQSLAMSDDGEQRVVSVRELVPTTNMNDQTARESGINDQTARESGSPVFALDRDYPAARNQEQEGRSEEENYLQRAIRPVPASQTRHDWRPGEQTERSGPGNRDRTESRQKHKSRARKYYLVDSRRGTRYGPMSALEVQSYYDAKRIDESFGVQKGRSSKTIPLKTFLRYFGPDGVKRKIQGKQAVTTLTQVKELPVPNKRGRANHGKAFVQFAKRAVPPFLAGMLVAVLVVLYMQPGGDFPAKENQTRTSRVQGAKGKMKPLPDEGSGSSRQATRRRSEKSTQTAAPDRREVRSSSSSSRPQASRELNAPSRRVEPLKRNNPPRIAPVRRATPAPSPGTSRAGSAATLLGMAGKKVIIGPLRFSVAELKACTGIRCVLKMVDQRGQAIEVVFFTAAFSAQLASKGGKIFISGTVRGDEKGLILEEVK